MGHEASTRTATSSLSRIGRHPIKTLVPLAMRRANLTRPVNVEIGGGYEFRGVLPEAISTNIWRSGLHDEATTQIIERLLQPGQTFLDIGSHFGYFSLVADRVVGQAGRVIAFEAMPDTYGYLARNMAQAKSQTDLVFGACWDGVETLEFQDAGIISSSLNSAFALREAPLTSQSVVKIEVEAQTADGALATRSVDQVHGMKIDAESSELRVLKGLEHTLNRDRPWIVIELGDTTGEPSSSVAIRELLEGHRMQPHILGSGSRFVPFDIGDGVAYANVVFLSDDHLAAVG